MLKSRIKNLIGNKYYNYLIYFKTFVKNKYGGYNKEYFENIEKVNYVHYDLFAKAIMTEFKPNTVVDIGCGSGGVSKALKDNGCKKIFAFDYSPASIEMTKSKGIHSVKRLNLTKAKNIHVSADVTICLEVAEHIPEVYVKNFCKLIIQPSKILVLSAAPKGQGGHLHINEQPKEYWVNLLKSYNMILDANSLSRIRSFFNGKMLKDYDENLMVFKKI